MPDAPTIGQSRGKIRACGLFPSAQVAQGQPLPPPKAARPQAGQRLEKRSGSQSPSGGTKKRTRFARAAPKRTSQAARKRTPKSCATRPIKRAQKTPPWPRPRRGERGGKAPGDNRKSAQNSRKPAGSFERIGTAIEDLVFLELVPTGCRQRTAVCLNNGFNHF